MPYSTSRSAIETRQACELQRFWNYDAFGRGLVALTEESAPALGTIIHAGLNQMYDPDETPYDPWWPDEMSQETRLIVFGLVEGYQRLFKAATLEMYDIVEREVEHTVNLPTYGFDIKVRYDMVLRNKATGRLVIRDYKTLSSNISEWQKFMENSLQTHMYIWLGEHIFGERIDGVEYHGLITGRNEWNKTEKVWFKNSPLAWRWVKDGLEIPEYRTGAKREAVEGTAYDRVKYLLHLGKLESLFPVIMPVRPDPYATNIIVKNALKGELEYQLKLKEFAELGETFVDIANVILTMNLGQCYKYGVRYPCEFARLCFEPFTQEEVKMWYKERKDHHAEGETDE